MEKINKLDELISKLLSHKEMREIVLKWSDRNKLGAVAIILSWVKKNSKEEDFSQQEEMMLKSCSFVASLLNADFESITGRLDKMLNNIMEN